MKTMTQLELDIATIIEMLKKFDTFFEDGTWVSGYSAECPMCAASGISCGNCALVEITSPSDNCHDYIPHGTRGSCFDANHYTKKAQHRWVLKAKDEFEYALVCLWDEYKEGE